jgi:hypothetical protein
MSPSFFMSIGQLSTTGVVSPSLSALACLSSDCTTLLVFPAVDLEQIAVVEPVLLGLSGSSKAEGGKGDEGFPMFAASSLMSGQVRGGATGDAHKRVMIGSSGAVQIYDCSSALDVLAARIAEKKASHRAAARLVVHAAPIEETASFLSSRAFKDTLVLVSSLGMEIWRYDPTASEQTRSSDTVSIITITHARMQREQLQLPADPTSDVKVVVTALHVDDSFIITGDNLGVISIRHRKSGALVRHLVDPQKRHAAGPAAVTAATRREQALLGMDFSRRTNTIDRVGRYLFAGFEDSKLSVFDVHEAPGGGGAPPPVEEYIHPHAGAIVQTIVSQGVVVALIRRNESLDEGKGKKDKKASGAAGSGTTQSVGARRRPEAVVWQPKLDGLEMLASSTSGETDQARLARMLLGTGEDTSSLASVVHSYSKCSSILSDMVTASGQELREFTSTMAAAEASLVDLIALKRAADADVPFDALQLLQAALDRYEAVLSRAASTGRLKRAVRSARSRRQLEALNDALASALASVDAHITELRMRHAEEVNKRIAAVGKATVRRRRRDKRRAVVLSDNDKAAVGANAPAAKVTNAEDYFDVRKLQQGKTVAANKAEAKEEAATPTRAPPAVAPTTTTTKQVPASAYSYADIPVFDRFGKFDNAIDATEATRLAAPENALDALEQVEDDEEDLWAIDGSDGRQLWRQVAGSARVTTVAWPTFLKALEARGGVVKSASALRSVLDKTGSGFVSQYRFGSWLSLFGPVKGAAGRFLELYRAPYFHGFLTSREATQLLSSQPHGTFLVRFAKSSPGKLALSVRVNRRVRHVAVESGAGGVACILVGTNSNTSTHYESLEKLVAAHKAILRTPLASPVTKEAWFQGDFSSADAQETLATQAPGTFLVRFSSQKAGAFVISFATEKSGVVQHSRVKTDEATKQVYLEGDKSGRRFATVKLLIDDFVTAGLLTNPYSYQ